MRDTIEKLTTYNDLLAASGTLVAGLQPTSAPLSLGAEIAFPLDYELRGGKWTLLLTLDNSNPVSIAPFDFKEFSLTSLWG